RLQMQSSRQQERLTEANYQTALMSLWNHLNLPADTRWELAGEWAEWRWRPLDDFLGVCPDCSPSGSTGGEVQGEPGGGASSLLQDDDAAIRQLIAARPDIVAARAGVAMASDNLRLAHAMRRPDLQIGPMWQRDDASTVYWGLQAQVDIPVVNTGRPLVAQRMAELREQQIAASQLENRATLEARAAIQRYERARRLMEQSRDESAGSMPDTLKLFEDQFQAGQITLIQVFAARVALVQSRQSFLDLLNEVALAAADVTQSTGLSAWQLVTESGPEPEMLEEVPGP
ncbi:MAG: TolC family protein, partial [Planctomycetes bacterium]|nr:TolC family protein [Planctomycetota bacterium]